MSTTTFKWHSSMLVLRSMYKDAEVEETTLFREARALGCRCPECRKGAIKGPRGSLNCLVSETTHLTGLDYCTHTRMQLDVAF